MLQIRERKSCRSKELRTAEVGKRTARQLLAAPSFTLCFWLQFFIDTKELFRVILESFQSRSTLPPPVSLPRSWRLPLDVSISAEIGFPSALYEENATTLEIRPILEKSLGRSQLDFNRSDRWGRYCRRMSSPTNFFQEETSRLLRTSSGTSG